MNTLHSESDSWVDVGEGGVVEKDKGAMPAQPLVMNGPGESVLPSAQADYWFKVSDERKQLEGLCFDRANNLYFVEVFGGTIYRLELATMKLTEIARLDGMNPAAIKIHRDGRLFVCCLGDFSSGAIVSMNPDGSERKTIVEGFVPDDLVFASDGSFYFTHFVGTPWSPSGAVLHVSADGAQITPVVENLAGPNGVALSTDESVLWVTETYANRLSRILLGADRRSFKPYGSGICYWFSGIPGPDSCCIDSEDNLYVAMVNHGRVMVFNRLGFPIRQIHVPGSSHGFHSKTTHPMLVPGTRDLLICTNDHGNNEGSWIFRAQGIAVAHKSYQFT
jgi:lactonase